MPHTVYSPPQYSGFFWDLRNHTPEYYRNIFGVSVSAFSLRDILRKIYTFCVLVLRVPIRSICSLSSRGVTQFCFRPRLIFVVSVLMLRITTVYSHRLLSSFITLMLVFTKTTSTRLALETKRPRSLPWENIVV